MRKTLLPSSPPPASLQGLTGRFSDYSLPQAEEYFQDYPGAAPGGTGETGLGPNDAAGYSDLLNLRDAVTHATNPNAVTRVGQSGGPALGSVPNLADDPSWWTGGKMAQTMPQEASDEDAMPSSIRGLYRAQYMKTQKARS